MKKNRIKSGIWKQLIFSILILVVTFSLLLVTPRIWSAMNPGKPPVGYHFEAPSYLAVGIGLEKLINMTPDIPADIQEIKNIEYKNNNAKSLQLDLYVPKNIVKPAPLLVFIHGGSWKGGKRSDYLVYLIAFAKKGYITASISYRLLEDGPFPACIEDVTDAVGWFFKNGENYGYDPDRIALIGGSAGAHLALLAAYGWENLVANDSLPIVTNKHKIKAVVDFYGPTDLTTEYLRTHPLVTDFLAHTYQENSGIFTEASPLHYLDKNDPPTMILHGTSDNLVPVSQSDTLKVRLDKLGVPNVYYRVPFWPHAMDVVQRVNEFSQLKMNDFFEKYLK